MIKTLGIFVTVLGWSTLACLGDIGHDADAKKIEVEIFEFSPMVDTKNWKELKSELYNPLPVAVTLRGVRGEGGDVKLERSVSVFGNIVWTELSLLQLAAGELFEIDGDKYRLSTNAPLVAGELMQFGFNFGPIGWKSYFFQIRAQIQP